MYLNRIGSPDLISLDPSMPTCTRLGPSYECINALINILADYHSKMCPVFRSIRRHDDETSPWACADERSRGRQRGNHQTEAQDVP